MEEIVKSLGIKLPELLTQIVGFVIAVRDKQLRDLLRPVWIFQAIMLTSYVVFVGGFWHFYRYLYPVYTLMLFLHAATLHYIESRHKLKPWLLAIVLFFLFVP